MGHPSKERLDALRSCYPYTSIEKQHICDTCHQAKEKKLPFPHSHTYTAKNFELLHIDIWGPCSVTSIHGYKFCLTIVDDYSRFT